MSSDLYSSSEPVQYKFLIPERSSQIDVPQLAYACSQTEEVGSGYSDTMEGLDSPGGDAGGAPSPASASTSRAPPENPLKRKRDSDMEREHPCLELTKASGTQVADLHPSRNNSFAPNAGTEMASEPGIRRDENHVMKGLGLDGQNQGTADVPGSLPRLPAIPAVIWQYIFCFVPPVFLGRLLRVNRAFHSFLTPDGVVSDHLKLPLSIAQPLKPRAIWIESRKRFARGVPRPLHDKEELDMWRLLIGHNCQICGHTKGNFFPTVPENSYEGGPGESGVRIIWPFGVRCCGVCLRSTSYKVSSPAMSVVT